MQIPLSKLNFPLPILHYYIESASTLHDFHGYEIQDCLFNRIDILGFRYKFHPKAFNNNAGIINFGYSFLPMSGSLFLFYEFKAKHFGGKIRS